MRWFSPDCYTVPEAEIDPVPGGVFNVCMRSPTGDNHWSRGRFLEVVQNERLVFEMTVDAAPGQPLFKATTTVTFSDGSCGTDLHVSQAYIIYQPMARHMIGGAAEGWSQTLGRLGNMLEADRYAGHTGRSVVHATFRLERRYRAAPATVFHALTDPQAKAKWFGGGGGYREVERMMDVRPGGREVLEGTWEGGRVSRFEATYFDVIPDQRLVYTYEMRMDGTKISVSLATFELKADGDGTQVVLTEQGAYLDGYDDAGSREHGTNFLLDALGKAVEQ
jgi:uncharacterized protein YndB with AHSA1/START domain